MGTYDDIVAAVWSRGDLTYDFSEPTNPDTNNSAMVIAMGTPGNTVLNIIDEWKETGMAWTPSPKPFQIMMLGLADWLDSHGVGGDAGFKNVATIGVPGTIPSSADLAVITASPVNPDLPLANSKAPYTTLVVKNMGAGPNTLTPSGADTLDGAGVGLPMLAWGTLSVYTDGISGWFTW